MFFGSRVPELSVQDLAALQVDDPDSYLLLDVRSTEEREYSDIGGMHIPVSDLPNRLSELASSRTKTLVVYCRSGHRSASVTAWLRSRGFEKAVNLAGGINEWSRTIDSTVRAY